MGKLDNWWQCRNDLVVENDLGLKAVVCRKVQKGIGWCGKRQQERVLKKKQKQAGNRTDQGRNRTPSIIKLRHGITRLNTLPGHLEHHLISSSVCISEAATPDTCTLTTFAIDTSATASCWLSKWSLSLSAATTFDSTSSTRTKLVEAISIAQLAKENKKELDFTKPYFSHRLGMLARAWSS